MAYMRCGPVAGKNVNTKKRTQINQLGPALRFRFLTWGKGRQVLLAKGIIKACIIHYHTLHYEARAQFA